MSQSPDRNPVTPRSWGSRLGEGLVMTVTLLLLRLLLAAVGLMRSGGFTGMLVQAVLFGVCWVVVGLVWDLVRGARRGSGL